MPASTEPNASIDHPVYVAVQTTEDPWATQKFMITVFDGTHKDIVCDDMTRQAADWLIDQLAHRPPYPHQ